MKEMKDTLLVALYNMFLIAMFGFLMYLVREWWLLFMLLFLASSRDIEEELK